MHRVILKWLGCAPTGGCQRMPAGRIGFKPLAIESVRGGEYRLMIPAKLNVVDEAHTVWLNAATKVETAR